MSKHIVFLSNLNNADVDPTSKDPFDEDKERFLNELHRKGILASEEEDNAYLETLEIIDKIKSFNGSHIGLTILPTICCNLMCPCCFEENKPKGTMTKEIADRIIEFIKSHIYAKTLNICWFGGEPLLGINIIEYILSKLSDIEGIKLISHTMISNGTLINDRVIEVFQKYPLDSIQITLDGIRETHDKKRIYPNGKGSFDEIIKNAERLVHELPNTTLSFRINVDNNNSTEYIELYNFLIEKFNKTKIKIYPGILRANRGCESEAFFSTQDHVNFYKNIRNNGINGYSYPVCESRGCTATCANGYVIGPNGEIYKCWEHVGKRNKIIGYITGSQIIDSELHRRFLIDGTGFTDRKCRECPIFPICSGGCPNKRIMNIMENTKEELCSIYNSNSRDALYSLLFEYYQNQNKK